ncbi:hypothetical protein [Hoeflea poritis]|uniref:Uncharacterized protein n=1 Tax=Hoeflea poritis TaxID=2993659 RepID=A0ABT4VKN4_9HYPH|nr:hypothetical protein [Hoeflea poritis]MDA4845277.1 hypothetical protein [Hoeflea poritis]
MINREAGRVRMVRRLNDSRSAAQAKNGPQGKKLTIIGNFLTFAEETTMTEGEMGREEKR